MLFPFEPSLHLDFPSSLISWSGWVILFLIVAILAVIVKGPKIRWQGRRWVWAGILTLCVFLTTPFLGLPLSGLLGSTLPAGEILPGPSVLVFLSALPWMIASGMLGTIPATLLGGLSGFLLAILNTHNLYTPLETASLALFFSLAVHQRYRTPFYRLLRHPFFSVWLVVIMSVPLYFYGALLAESRISRAALE